MPGKDSESSVRYFKIAEILSLEKEKKKKKMQGIFVGIKRCLTPQQQFDFLQHVVESLHDVRARERDRTKEARVMVRWEPANVCSVIRPLIAID